MAYNLQSLITILQQILDPEQTRWIVNKNKPLLESILEKAESLQQLLEKCPLPKVAVSLERRIRDAAFRAEDVIESRMVRQMLSAPQGVDRSLVLFSFFTPYLEQVKQQLDLQQDLERVTQELDFAMQQVVKLMEGTMMLGGSGPIPDHVQQSVKLMEVEEKKMLAGGRLSSAKNDLVVGVDKQLFELKDRLTKLEGKMEFISIIGMGGVGKTKLAGKLYNDPLIINHFDYRVWAAISQHYNGREILLRLIGGPNENISDEVNKCSKDELKEKLYGRLLHRRYMIVLDDIWSAEILDDIRMCFPDNNNGSRIVITTRDADIGRNGPNYVGFQVRYLSDSESWDLLRQIVFGEKDCPLELKGLGTTIVRNCRGVPIVIQVIGGFLAKVERSRVVWEHFLTELEALFVESEGHFPLFSVFSWRYNHLPIYLKPCFLYMGAFQEDYEIKGCRLVSLMIAEGFVQCNGDESLEEVAEDYLKALVDRNLLSVTRKKSNGKPLSYSIRDLLWDLCRREANEDKFRCVSFQPSYEMEDEYVSPQLMPHARSFICTWKKNISPVFSALRLLRVLDVIRMVFEELPGEILQLVNLRYLAFSHAPSLPIGISRLWYLQTLISAQYESYVPSELWEMSELRHLKLITKFKIKETTFVHEKLQTLSCVWLIPSLIRSGFFETIPNIRKLGIYYEDSPEIEVDLRHLHKLERLKCESALDKDGRRFLHQLRFPCNLRKLTLDSCVVFGSLFTTLCALPNLEVLKIEYCVFESEAEKEWVATEGDEFRSLQYLYLKDLNLVRWKADETNFPTLRNLIVRGCYELEEIPSAIGDIPTLQEISIHGCGGSVVNSAQQIRMEQEDCGNNDLKVVITH